MSEKPDLLSQLEAANSDDDVLAVFAKANGPVIPSMAQLETWYRGCLQSAKNEANARLRALWPNDPLRCYELFPSQHSLALGSSVGDASPLVITRPFLSAWKRDSTLKHPWAILVKSWQAHCPPARANLIVTKERKPPPDRRALDLNRAAAVLHLTSLAVVEVDGEPFVSDAPLRPGTVQRYRVMPTIDQPNLGPVLKPYPETIQGQATAGVVVEALAHLDLTGDERSPLRADMLRLGEIAFALTRTIHVSEAEGAVLLGGKNTPALRRRLNRALWGLRSLRVQVRDGVFYALADAEPGPVNALGRAPGGGWKRCVSMSGGGEGGKGSVDAFRPLSNLWPTGYRVDCSGPGRLGGRVADDAGPKWEYRDAWERPSLGLRPRLRGDGPPVAGKVRGCPAT